MKMLVLSDLHVEFAPFEATTPGGPRLDADADVVVLAGDIHNGVAGITWARQTFDDKPVVYVPGNHELYEGDWDRTLDAMRGAAQREGVHLLEDNAVTLGGVRFLGTTPWTDYALFGEATRQDAITAASRVMVDYRLIRVDREARLLHAQDTMARHARSRQWLEQALATGDPARTVVVTHHYPSIASTAPAYRDDLTSAAFGSALDGLMGRAAVWVHGHTHTSFDYTLGGTRVVCNPRGYWRRRAGQFENPQFQADKLVYVAAP